jgi:hypothetical protein
MGKSELCGLAYGVAEYADREPQLSEAVEAKEKSA